MQERRAIKIPYLDGWRGLAIIAVLVCHFGPRPAVGWIGDFGVQMFFALSGFLMGQLLFVKKVALPDFFFRRASRILPVFFMYVSCMYLYAQFFQARPYTVPLDELLSTVLFLRTYFPSEISIWANDWPIGNVWSLNVEEHSYVFLAILALIARKMESHRVANILLIGAVLACMGTYFYYLATPPSGASKWELRSECAAIGLLTSAALITLRHSYEPKVPTEAWSMLVILLVASSMFLMSAYRLKGGNVVFGPILLALAVNYLHTLPVIVKSALSNPALLWFGKCSFSLYLWQQPFYVAVQKAGLPVYVGLTSALVVAAVSFYAIEDPLRIKLNRAWSRRHASRVRAEFSPQFDDDISRPIQKT